LAKHPDPSSLCAASESLHFTSFYFLLAPSAPRDWYREGKKKKKKKPSVSVITIASPSPKHFTILSC
jgi:hypothetical protein